jgi:hypothetical protein
MPTQTGIPGIVIKGSAGLTTAQNNFTAIDTTAVVPIGTVACDASQPDNEFIYLTGVASTAIGSVVTYDELFITTLIAANAIGPVAVAMAATVASTFGWYQIRGKNVVVSCDAGVVDNSKVYIDGTSGRVDDTVVAGDQVSNAVFRSTDTSNICTLQMQYPYVNDSLG